MRNTINQLDYDDFECTFWYQDGHETHHAEDLVSAIKYIKDSAMAYNFTELRTDEIKIVLLDDSYRDTAEDFSLDNRKDYTRYLAIYEKFQEKIKSVAAEYAKLSDQHFSAHDAHIDEIGDNIYFNWSEPCGRGCCTEHYSLDMPASCLWDNNWRIELKNKLEAAALSKKKLEAENKAKKESEYNSSIIKEYNRIMDTK